MDLQQTYFLSAFHLMSSFTTDKKEMGENNWLSGTKKGSKWKPKYNRIFFN